MSDHVKMEITEGTITRKEKIDVIYKPGNKPTLEMDITRPYKVTANGQTEGIDEYHLVSTGRKVNIATRVSEVGLVRAIKAAIDAYRNPAIEGGITPEDVKEATEGGEQYNKVVEEYGKVAGQKTTIETSKELKIEDLSDKERTEFGLAVELKE